MNGASYQIKNHDNFNSAFAIKKVDGGKAVEQPNATILVVEDEDVLVDILEYNLHRQGYRVLTATDGLEACRVIGREKPDLILLDIMLPLLNGWEICRMIRLHSDRSIATTPIIILSALGTNEDRLKGYDLGANMYLPKPYNMREVLLQTNQLLEQRWIQEQLEGIQQLFNLQDQWQQALFHELRNQLTVISGMAEYICGNSNPKDKHVNQFNQQISNSSQYLSSLAENYLLVRQIEDGRELPSTEPFDLEVLLHELRDIFSQRMSNKTNQLQLRHEKIGPVHQHQIGLKIVLSSLIENALKYSDPETPLTLSVELHKNAQLIFRVENKGVDIPLEEQDRIFEKFYRGKAVKGGGSGLGLYFSQTLAQAMGGKLILESSKNGHTCFALILPHS